MEQQSRQTTRAKVDDIMLSISWQDLTRNYFGKSSSWFYNKLHERDVNGNGKREQFSPEELEVLKGALCDIADRLRKTADSL